MPSYLRPLSRFKVLLAGHATLAVVHSLYLSSLSQEGLVTISTRAGELQCNISPATPHHGGNPFITAEFPSVSTSEIQNQPSAPETVRLALGGGAVPLPVWIGRAETNDLLVVFESADVIRGMQPDLAACKQLSPRGVIVTAAARGAPWAGEADFVCRWFAPSIGIDEGATTVSAHCALGPFWAQRLGRLNLIGFQSAASAPRSGRAVSIAMHVNLEAGRTTLAGRCVTTLRGEVLAGPAFVRRTNSGFMMSQG